MTRLALVIVLVACGGTARAPAPVARSAAAETAPDSAQPEPAGPGAEGEGVEEDDTRILDDEAIGPLRFGASDAEILELLGAPKDRSPAVLEGATGAYYSSWSWPGVTLGMMADETHGPWKARLIEVTAPSKLATKAGIRIGSSRTEVEARYRRGQMDRGEPEELLVGSPYGGLFFTFKDGVVTSMSIGVFAF